MTEYSKIIEDIESKLKQINKSETECRYKEIDSNLKIGKLSSDLNCNELIYTHTKLHMLYTYKKPVISKENISKLHEELIKRMDKHLSVDTLDTTGHTKNRNI